MNTELIMQAFEVMWKGMLSIFTVIVILTLLVVPDQQISENKNQGQKGLNPKKAQSFFYFSYDLLSTSS